MASVLSHEVHGTGPTVVLLHAFPMDRRLFLPQRPLASSVRLVTPDLAGFGGSAGIRATTMEEHARLVVDLLDALGAERAVVGGVSMGGYVALALARAFPGRLSGLVLADTRAGPDSPEGRAGRDANITLVRNEGVPRLVENMMPRLLAPASMHLADTVRGFSSGQAPQGVCDALVAMRDRREQLDMLKSLTVKTLVLVGELDLTTPPAESHAMAAAARGARLVVVPRAGHLANLEQPEAFNEALRSFA